MGLIDLSRSGAANRMSRVDSAPSSDAVSSGSAPSILKSLSEFVPTEVVAIFLPGIAIINAAIKDKGPLFSGCTDLPLGQWWCHDTQAFWAWTWFDVCCVLTLCFYYISFALSWRQERAGALPRRVDLLTGIAAFQATAALLGFFAWGLSVAPTGILMWPGAGDGTDPHPYVSLLALILSPLFVSVNQLISYRGTAA